MLDNDDLGMMLQYEIPLLQSIIKQYESMGYSHVNAQLLAVNKYSRELRIGFENGIEPSEMEKTIQLELDNEKLFVKLRGATE